MLTLGEVLANRIGNPQTVRASAGVLSSCWLTWHVSFDHDGFSDMCFGDDQIVDVEIVIVLRIRDRRLQTFAYVGGDSLARKFQIGACSTRFQNSRNLARRSCVGLPAISAALMAPIDVPMIQSGAMPASCRA